MPAAGTGSDGRWKMSPAAAPGRLRPAIWVLAAIDLAAGAYLLVYAQRRERRDKPGVLAVGVTLFVCAALLGGLGSWQALQEPAEPVALDSSDLPAIRQAAGAGVTR